MTLDGNSRPGSPHHISGLYSGILAMSLEGNLSAEAVLQVLARADESRSLEELKDVSSWNSYGEFRRLLQETVRTLGPPSTVLAATSDLRHVNDEMGSIIQSFGSPEALISSGGTTNPLMPIRHYEPTSEVGPNEWIIGESFADEFEPYPEFCAFVASQYSRLPAYFGLALGVVVEERCQCNGDPFCQFRVSWQLEDKTASRIQYLEAHSELLERRLEQLQRMVTDLASNERYEDVLQGIVDSTMHAAGAGGVLLALEPRTGQSRKVYFTGLTGPEAASIADDLLEGGARRGRHVTVEVRSVRRHYGVLAIHEGDRVVSSPSRGLLETYGELVLETYGQLAAATLDAADAFDDARHQAATAQVLLDLSTSLAEIVSFQDMAAKVARAVPDVIDCDRAAIFLDGGDVQGGVNGEFRLAASVGYDEALVADMSSQAYDAGEHETVSEQGIVRRLTSGPDDSATICAPIIVAGESIGYVAASVTTDPERLDITPRLADRLKGLAAQASIAISNARLVDQIRFQALHDPLTGLPNRTLILDRAEQMLARARRSYLPVAALFIDLDGFKDVNDTLGHGAGDQLLRAVTARLTAAMREGDSIGRFGGDEFVVLVDGSTMDAGPELVAERLLAVLREPFAVLGAPGDGLRLTASIGIAAGVRSSATELLRDADIALYEAKTAGKNNFVVFLPEMHTAVQNRLILEMDLRAAFRNQQYFLVYQPIFNLASGVTTGVEALLRWRHPERGVVQPDAFIPILEDTGMITDVGRWVLYDACLQGAAWHALGYRLDISVNVSARQLQTDAFVNDVRAALAASGLDAHSLVIEITETAIMANVAAVVPRLAAIKEMGVRIAIDDFGTGYSSLAYLQQFPVDTIKIDRSFISAMAETPESGALIRTLVQLGKSLGLETLAEGIEDTGQYTQLALAQCDSGQGFLVARPLEVEDVASFLADHKVPCSPRLSESVNPL
jgi:diguanylate cyclase (GGDEF)-like protein